MRVTDALLVTVRLDNRCDAGIVRVVHPGEQMVLNLVVQASVHEAQP